MRNVCIHIEIFNKFDVGLQTELSLLKSLLMQDFSVFFSVELSDTQESFKLDQIEMLKRFQRHFSFYITEL